TSTFCPGVSVLTVVTATVIEPVPLSLTETLVMSGALLESPTGSVKETGEAPAPAAAKAATASATASVAGRPMAFVIDRTSCKTAGPCRLGKSRCPTIAPDAHVSLTGAPVEVTPSFAQTSG